MVDRSTNTATSAPHRSHAVAGWSQAAGTPHDPTTPYLLATPQALRNSAPGGSKPPGRYRGWTPYKLVPACNATGSA